MDLVLRSIRSFGLFVKIFASYMVQLVLIILFQLSSDPKTGEEKEWIPKWLERREERVDQANARRLREGIARLGGVYIKLGQVLSIMGGFLPKAFGVELESLQDRVPARSFLDIEAVFCSQFGKTPKECFRSIEEVPVAAASLGQVHVAYLQDGTKVAMKVLYPGIREMIRTDMRIIRMALRVYNWFVPVENLENVHESLVDLLRRETDYLHEAECIERMSKNFTDEKDIVFPQVIREFTSKDVLTMTYIEGIKITRIEELRTAGIDPTLVAKRLVQCFYKQIFVDRLFHADPHPGNFLVQPGDTPNRPRIVILDFGAVSEAAENMVDGLVGLLQGLLEQDEKLAFESFEQIGFIAYEGDRDLLERTVKLYFQKLLRVKNRTPDALMKAKRSELEKLVDPEVERGELRELMMSVRYPNGWFYVERTGVLLFWLAAQLDPHLDTIKVGFPYVAPLLAKRTAGRETPSVAPEAESAPKA